MIELRHYRYFVAVAELLHFGRAAERLHISQPPLSTQIRQLEEMLGVQLFLRSQRKVSLSEAGQVFLEEARRVLDASERAVEAVQQAARGVRGRLALGFASSAPFGFLPRVLHSYRNRYPEVTLVLHELGSAEQLRGLQERRLDVGFVRLPAQATGITVDKIAQERLMMALPEAHPLADRPELQLFDFRLDPWVLFPRREGPGLYDRIIGLCASAGFNPQISQEVGQMHAIVGLVGAGLGVSLVPESMQSVQARGLIYRHLADEMVTEIGLAYRAETHSPVQDAFLQLARSLATTPPQESDKVSSSPD